MTKGRATVHPTRTCVGCGQRDRQAALVRLRRDASDRVVPNSSVQAGRSAYVHDRPDCVRGLVRSKGLGKSLRQNVDKEARLELVATLETAGAIARQTDRATAN